MIFSMLKKQFTNPYLIPVYKLLLLLILIILFYNLNIGIRFIIKINFYLSLFLLFLLFNYLFIIIQNIFFYQKKIFEIKNPQKTNFDLKYSNLSLFTPFKLLYNILNSLAYLTIYSLIIRFKQYDTINFKSLVAILITLCFKILIFLIFNLPLRIQSLIFFLIKNNRSLS